MPRGVALLRRREFSLAWGGFFVWGGVYGVRGVGGVAGCGLGGGGGVGFVGVWCGVGLRRRNSYAKGDWPCGTAKP